MTPRCLPGRLFTVADAAGALQQTAATVAKKIALPDDIMASTRSPFRQAFRSFRRAQGDPLERRARRALFAPRACLKASGGCAPGEEILGGVNAGHSGFAQAKVSRGPLPNQLGGRHRD